MNYAQLLSIGLERFGSEDKLFKHLPQAKTADELRKLANDRYLSLIALCNMAMV